MLVLMASFNFAHAEKAKTIKWDDLLPEMNIPKDGLRKELDGQKVRLPGFITPLEADMEKKLITEFLLVPYFGACIHVPPPPVNQIVHVKKPKEFEINLAYGPVWIEGIIKVGEVKSDIATSGYSMEEATVTEYK